jgi:hypothetical protein
MSTFIKRKQTVRWKKPRKPMVYGDVDSAHAVTHTRHAERKEDGSMYFTHVLDYIFSMAAHDLSGQF